MTGFCVEFIRCEPQLRPEHGVLRVAAMAVTTDARRAADRIVQDARDEAGAILRHARDEAAANARKAEQDVLERALRLLRALEDTRTNLLHRSQDIVVSLAQGMFERLAAAVTPRERVEAMIKHILQEAQPHPRDPLLRLHPDDVEHAEDFGLEVKPDPSLAPGTCRLEAVNGEWFADFSAAVASLKDALEHVAASVAEKDDAVADAPADSGADRQTMPHVDREPPT